MKCPYCKSENHTVIDHSRASEYANVVRRRRICNDCGKKFWTVEEYALDEVCKMKKRRK